MGVIVCLWVSMGFWVSMSFWVSVGVYRVRPDYYYILVQSDRSFRKKNNGKCRIFLAAKFNELYVMKFVQFQPMTEVFSTVGGA